MASFTDSGLLYVLVKMVGSSVRVTLKNGAVYRGIFHAASEDLGICLRMARRLDPEASFVCIDSLIIPGKDVYMVSVSDLDMGEQAKGFQTDTSISKGILSGGPRELQKWEPDQVPDTQMDLESESGTNWDQFETNEKLFGVVTDYQEEIYTTKLDTEGSDFRQREREAARLAKEIEKAATGNIHIAEERGQNVGAEDEEDRYGAVIRTDPSKPPHVRKPSNVGHIVDKRTHDAKDRQSQKTPVQMPEKSHRPNAVLEKKKEVITIKTPDTHIIRETTFKEKEQIQLKKQALMRMEKDGILNDFKKFSANFKLNTPVPEDIADILKKSKLNNDDKKEEKNPTPSKPVGQPLPVYGKNWTNKPAEQPVVSESMNDKIEPPPTAKKSSTKFKFNVDASEFKPNPDAAEFIPGAVSAPPPVLIPFFGEKKTITGPSFKQKLLNQCSKQGAIEQMESTWPFGTKSSKSQLVPGDNGSYPMIMDQGFGYTVPPAQYVQYGRSVMPAPFVIPAPIPSGMNPAYYVPGYSPASPAVFVPNLGNPVNLANNRPMGTPQMVPLMPGLSTFEGLVPVVVPMTTWDPTGEQERNV